EQALVEEKERHGEGALPGHAGAAQVAACAPPGGGQRRGDLAHAFVLGRVLLGAPHGVVEVLASPGGVRADRLDVTVLVRADPDVGPRRRDHQITTPGHQGGAGETAAIGVQVDPAASAPTTAPSRCLEVHLVERTHSHPAVLACPGTTSTISA